MRTLFVDRQSRSLAAVVCHLCCLLVLSAAALPQSAVSAIPPMIKFSGVVKDAQGKPRTGIVGVTFALYKDEQGGAPLWLETQNVTVDAQGRYSVYLGAATSAGVPQELFVSGEARWLGVRPEGQAEQPRTLLLSVPYAMKAGDAATIGGLPPSAFVLAVPAGNASPIAATASPSALPPASSVTTAGGTVNAVPLWSTATDIENSVISQTGSGTTAKIGINTSTPTTTLDVKGAATVRGALLLPSTGAATAAAGKNSQPLKFVGSAFNSGTSTPVNQTFQWQAEAAGNNTANASGTLSLLYGLGTAAPTETGLKLGSNGLLTFAAGQTFPGAGTITGVTAGTGLTGGGTGGNITLNLDPTKVPQLGTANLFTNNQTITGNLNASGTVTSSVVNATSGFNLQGSAFAYGSSATNLFLGFGTGNTSATGTLNTGVGVAVLPALTTGIGNVALGWDVLSNNDIGSENTATGRLALQLNTKGSTNVANGERALQNNTIGDDNTAVGTAALVYNTTGNGNTALGIFAGPDQSTPNLTNSTAIGANALVTASNSLVLGSINGTNGAVADTFVGIGTTAPAAKLDVHGNANFTGLITFASSQTFPGTGTIMGVTAGTGLTGGGTSGNVTVNLDTSKVPQLSTANTFTGNQTVNANLTSTGVVSAASYQIGSNLFASGNATTNNVYLGFAGNKTTTGYGNTGVGGQALVAEASGINNTAAGQAALPANTSGSDNVAMGVDALQANTLGSGNTGIGVIALANNTGGSNNTALGFGAGPDLSHPSLTNATAIGANAVVSESNALVLGGTGLSAVNVGIGTATPAFPLHVNGAVRAETGLYLGGNAPVAVDAPGVPGGRLTILANGNVGINNPSPTTTLDVHGNIDASGSLIGGNLNVSGGGVINGGLVTSAGITTGAGVGVGAGLSVTGNTTLSGSLQIKGDTPMNAAPHMYLTGYTQGPVSGDTIYQPIFLIPSRSILITRMTVAGDPNGCSANPITFSIENENTTPWVNLFSLNLPASGFTVDSGSLSIPVSSGTNLGVVFDPPLCNIGASAPTNISISVEYVMQ